SLYLSHVLSISKVKIENPWIFQLRIVTRRKGGRTTITNRHCTPSLTNFGGHWILTNVCITQADILASASSTAA
ncbi:unnamed protein product, partial [Prunus brigantina]